MAFFSSRWVSFPILRLLIVLVAIGCWPQLLSAEHADPRMEKIIRAIEESEKKIERLDVTIVRETHYDEKKWTMPKRVETVRTVRQPNLFFAERTRIDHFVDETEVTYRSAAFYDGQKTTAVEYDNSVNILQYRYEPSYVYPPHNWGLFHLNVNFPLSTYLRGTEALKKDPKVRQLPRPTGSIFEFYVADSKYIGEEEFNGTPCVKIQVLKRHEPNGRPSIQYLWLSKEHHYLCLRAQQVFELPDRVDVRSEATVDAVREFSPGVTVPQKATIKKYDLAALREGTNKVLTTDSFIIKALKTDIDYSIDELAIDVPEELPKYVINADRQLVDSPNHPHPTNKKPTTTLEEIIENIRAAEEVIPDLEIHVDENYRYSERENSAIGQGGATLWIKGASRSVISQGQIYFFETTKSPSSEGTLLRRQMTQVYNGRATRREDQNDYRTPGILRTTSSRFSPKYKDSFEIVRPHTLVMRSLREYRPLSEVLLAENFSARSESSQAVIYEGDENINGLLCHRIRRDLVRKNSPPSLSHTLWVSPDRNYLPLRCEWNANSKHETLPTSVTVATDLKEIRPGIWIALHVRTTPFRWFSADGLMEDRLIHMWQRDYRITDVSLDPDVKEINFSELLVPAGTKIFIRNENGESIGSINQLEDGNIDISDEQLEELQEAYEARRK